LDREHEHGAGRQQETVSDERRDHSDVAVDEPDLRADGPRGSVAGHRVSLRHDLHGAGDARLETAVPVVAEQAARSFQRPVQGKVIRQRRIQEFAKGDRSLSFPFSPLVSFFLLPLPTPPIRGRTP